MTRRCAFTLIELLVVVAIIALLISILMPSLQGARETSRRVVCGHNLHMLTLGAIQYTVDNQEWYNPIQNRHRLDNGSIVEGTWRVYLWEYIAQQPDVVDCPSEADERYSDGLSAYDVEQSRNRPGHPNRNQVNPEVFGKLHRFEIFNGSGIGANLAHYWSTVAHGPFGRPHEDATGDPGSGYPEGLTKAGVNVKRPSNLILFGDGHGDAKGEWGEDRFWIFFWDPPLRPERGGYDRNLQGDPGAIRHSGKANYSFADGSVRLYNASDIPCTPGNIDEAGECWWSVEAYPHADE